MPKRYRYLHPDFDAYERERMQMYAEAMTREELVDHVVMTGMKAREIHRHRVEMDPRTLPEFKDERTRMAMTHLFVLSMGPHASGVNGRDFFPVRSDLLADNRKHRNHRSRSRRELLAIHFSHTLMLYEDEALLVLREADGDAVGAVHRHHDSRRWVLSTLDDHNIPAWIPFGSFGEAVDRAQGRFVGIVGAVIPIDEKLRGDPDPIGSAHEELRRLRSTTA